MATLGRCRERLWAVLAKRCPGTVRTQGAFYFLARLPEGVVEEEAVHTLATEFRVLCTPGRCARVFVCLFDVETQQAEARPGSSSSLPLLSY